MLVRAASSATIVTLLCNAVLLYAIFKEGWSTTSLVNAIVLVSGLWIVGWPYAPGERRDVEAGDRAALVT